MLVGFFVSFIYCPVEYAKIKKQTSGNMKKGSFMFLVEEMKKTQLKNIYQGLTATLVR